MINRRLTGLLTPLSPKATFFSIRTVWKLFHPSRNNSASTTSWSGSDVEYFRVESSRDRVSLAGYFLPGNGSDAVVVCHGLGETAVGVQAHAELLQSSGYHVAVFDLRGHGRSSGHHKATQLGDRYVSDLAAIVDYVRADARVSGSIGLLALSFSTWIALRSCVTGETGAIAALVCDSGPERTTGRALGNIVGARSALEPNRISSQREEIARFSCELAQRMIGERNWPPAKLEVPTLFIIGKRDRVIHAREVQSLARLYPNTDVYIDPRASHVKSYKVNRDAYSLRVVGHFNKYLSSNLGARSETAS